MTRQYLSIILFVVLLVSLFLITGCSEAVSASATQTTSIVTQTIILPTSVSQPGVNTAVTTAVPSISIKDASNLIKKNNLNPDFIIVDLRTPDEFNSGYLANAVNIDYYSPDFKSNIDKLDRNREYLVYCRSGIRGAAATQIMIDLGFTKVYNLSGGIVQWIDAGNPILK